MNAIDADQLAAVERLAAPGDWLTAAQRCDAWDQARQAATNPLDLERKAALSPYAVVGDHPATAELSAAAVEVVHRVASDPGRLTRTWADIQIAALGEETYTELVGVVAIAMVIDRYRLAMGLQTVAIPEPVPGDPARERPKDIGDIGAWVSQSTDKTLANVSRTLSMVPVTNATWRSLVTSHYSRGPEFMNLAWDQALTRPQTELVATRTTALNECFY